MPALPELIGGSADLTGSNLTLVKGMAVAREGADTGARPGGLIRSV